MNHLIVTGRVGNDATTANVSGKSVINFNVAHSERYRNPNGENVEKTVWFSVQYFSEKVSIAAYIKKGTQLTVIGSVDVRQYDDRNGNKVAQLVIRASKIELLGSAPTNTEQQAKSPVSETKPVSSGVADIYAGKSEPIDNLPF